MLTTNTLLAKLASTIVRYPYLAVQTQLLLGLPEEAFALALNGLRGVLRLPCDLKRLADFQNEDNDDD